MQLDGFTTTNVLNDSITFDYDDENAFLRWAERTFEIKADKVTKKFLDELSRCDGIVEIAFSKNHDWLYVDYEDEEEVDEYNEARMVDDRLLDRELREPDECPY